MRSTSLRLILLIIAAWLPAGAAAAAEAPDDSLRGTLRIRLLEQLTPKSATVQAGSYGVSVYSADGGRPLFDVGPGQSIRLESRRGEILLTGLRQSARTALVRLEPLGPGDLILRVGSTSRSYSGNLYVGVDEGSTTLKLINHVPLEDYVAAVVASEYGLDDLEGSKAMAVIARTYGLKVIGSSDDSYDHVDHTASQVYRGSRTVTRLARQAAAATRGQVLTYRGSLIEAVYSSSSGGHTANNEDVWKSAPHAYLRGRIDPYDRIAPDHNWEYRVSHDDLHQALKEALGMSLKEVKVSERNVDGRAASMRLIPRGGRERTISADEFRRILRTAFGEKSIRSTKFELDRRRREYVFTGQGFGHGVGLSQWGARGMALAGKDYRQILDFYYTDVALEQRRVSGPTVSAGGGLLASSDSRSLRPGTPSPITTQAPPLRALSSDTPTKPSSGSPDRKTRRRGW